MRYLFQARNTFDDYESIALIMHIRARISLDSPLQWSKLKDRARERAGKTMPELACVLRARDQSANLISFFITRVTFSWVTSAGEVMFDTTMTAIHLRIPDALKGTPGMLQFAELQFGVG